MPRKLKKPTPLQVRKLRKVIQEREKLNITMAQERCAEIAGITHRTWQTWETDEDRATHRKMPIATWKLVKEVIIR